MTKLEALRVMKKGFKITHRYFLPTEWMTLEGENFLFDDGVTISQEEFWKNRNTIDWQEGYEYWKEAKQ